MNEIETKDNDRKWLEFRIATTLLVFIVLFIALLARAFQLQVLSSDLLKARYTQQNAKALETKIMIKDLTQGLDELNTEQKRLMASNNILSVEKTILLKEIEELSTRYNKLSNDIQLLQKTLNDLSALQEKETENLIRMYDRIYRTEKWTSFIGSFLMGIITSIIASIIYSKAAKRSKMPSIRYFIDMIKDRLSHMRIG